MLYEVITSNPNPAVVTGAISTYSAASTKGRGIYIIDMKTGAVLAEKKFGSVADNQASMSYNFV